MNSKETNPTLIINQIRKLQKEIKIREKQIKKLNVLLQNQFKEKLSDLFIIDQSDEAYKLLVRNSNAIITFFDKEFRIVFYHTPPISEFRIQNIHGRKINQVYDEITTEKIQKQVLNVFNSKNPQIIENELQINGKTYWFFDNYYPIFNSKNEIWFVARISHDITDQKKMKIALEQEREKFKLLFNIGPDLKFVHYFDEKFYPSKFLEVNETAINMLGYSREELLNLKLQDLIPNIEIKQDKLKRVATTLKERNIVVFETNLKTKNNKIIPFELTCQLFFNEEKKTCCLTIGRDITFRKQFELKLKENEFRYRSIFHYNPVGLIEEDLSNAISNIKGKMQLDDNSLFNEDNIISFLLQDINNLLEFFKNVKIIEVNQAVIDIFELESIDQISEFITNLHFTEIDKSKEIKIDYEKIRRNFKILFSLKPYENEFKFKTKNGRFKEVICKITPIPPPINLLDFSDITDLPDSLKIPLNIPTRFLIIVIDITEKRILEKEFQKAQKLESLGLLAGGIAHDFNNFLTSILGNISIVKSEIDKNMNIFQDLTNAENAALHAKNITKQLLTFAKGGAPVKKPLSLEKLIYDSVNFCLSGSSIKPIFNIEENLYKVYVDEGQIIQVINNLIINAIQAMPKDGVIFIRLSNLNINIDNFNEFEKNNPKLIKNILQNLNKEELLKNPRKFVKIEIEDQGCGIPEENLDKIFDPFFTTKEFGSGLGLTICYSIIKNHNGYIDVSSELNKGTIVTIYLPAVETSVDQEPEPIKIEYKSSGFVFVLEDEPTVAKVLSKMLGKLGFQAIIEENSELLVKKFKEFKESNKVVKFFILDLTIPGGKGGIDTIKELLKIDPNIIAFASSGYSDSLSIEQLNNAGFVDFLPKPYTLNDLKIKISKYIL